MLPHPSTHPRSKRRSKTLAQVSQDRVSVLFIQEQDGLRDETLHFGLYFSHCINVPQVMGSPVSISTDVAVTTHTSTKREWTTMCPRWLGLQSVQRSETEQEVRKSCDDSYRRSRHIVTSFGDPQEDHEPKPRREAACKRLIVYDVKRSEKDRGA